MPLTIYCILLRFDSFSLDSIWKKKKKVSNRLILTKWSTCWHSKTYYWQLKIRYRSIYVHILAKWLLSLQFFRESVKAEFSCYFAFLSNSYGGYFLHSKQLALYICPILSLLHLPPQEHIHIYHCYNDILEIVTS